MGRISFQTLSFSTKEDYLQVTLLRLFVTKIPLKEVSGLKVLDPHTIEYANEKRFYLILAKYFKKLTNKLTGNKVTYVDASSGLPLIGNVAFGIVYRGSSIIEIKPVTSCNLDCIYCSISEGLSSKKHDFVVEKDYLVGELKELVNFLDDKVEIHIGVQGEPFLYGDMEELIKDLQAMKNVHTISIDSNGTLLNKPLIDRLAVNTKLQLNLSLDAITDDQAKAIAGVKHYNVKHVLEMIDYATQKLSKVIVAPVFTDGWNNDELEKIILFIKSLNKQPILGIQNYLKYKTGRNAAKEITWDKFYAMIEMLEKKHDIKLKLNKEDFNIRKLKALPKPFFEGQEISAVLKCVDRFPNSSIAVARGRSISVPGC